MYPYLFAANPKERDQNHPTSHPQYMNTQTSAKKVIMNTKIKGKSLFVFVCACSDIFWGQICTWVLYVLKYIKEKVVFLNVIILEVTKNLLLMKNSGKDLQLVSFWGAAL